jgi:hypothetical protein
VQDQRDRIAVRSSRRIGADARADSKPASRFDRPDGNAARTCGRLGIGVPVVANHQQNRAPIVEQRPDLRFSQLRIDRHRDRRGAADDEEQEHGRNGVLDHERDRITWLDPQPAESRRQFLHELTQLRVREPPAALGFDKREPIRAGEQITHHLRPLLFHASSPLLSVNPASCPNYPPSAFSSAAPSGEPFPVQASQPAPAW